MLTRWIHRVFQYLCGCAAREELRTLTRSARVFELIRSHRSLRHLASNHSRAP